MKWQLAKLIDIQTESARIKSFTFSLPEGKPFFPGQHMDIRLRAEDGYEAQRSYSIASSPDTIDQITLTIDLLPDGEVSGFLHEEARVGDYFELKGPIGGYFIWKPHFQRPLFLIGGGSGLVPLMSILRTRKQLQERVTANLLFSVKSPADYLYREELMAMEKEDEGFHLRVRYTRTAPDNWQEEVGRINKELLAEELKQIAGKPLCYVCGPTAMVEFVANTLVELGLDGALVRTERFG